MKIKMRINSRSCGLNQVEAGLFYQGRLYKKLVQPRQLKVDIKPFHRIVDHLAMSLDKIFKSLIINVAHQII